jgi:hypothetical protein
LRHRQRTPLDPETRVARWQTKTPGLGKFWSVLQRKMLVYFMAISSQLISWTFGMFYCYLVYFSRFGMLYQEKSGNPDPETVF